MRLCEHPDFEQAILRAAEHFQNRGLRPAIIEKDYYVTEALRELALSAGDHLIFKRIPQQCHTRWPPAASEAATT